MAGSNAPAPVDRFVACSWSCGACGEHGGARPWQRPGETPAAAVSRFSSETRGRCVQGCAFTATSAEGANHGC